MSAKISIARTDHTAESLRRLASGRKYRDCWVRLRAMTLLIEDDLSRREISRAVGGDVQPLCEYVATRTLRV